MISKINRKKSVLAVIIVSFWVAYVTLNTLEYRQEVSENVDAVRQDQKKSIDYALEFSTSLIIKNDTDYLSERLSRSVDIQMFDFFILQKKDKVVSFSNFGQGPDEINHDYKNFNIFMETPDVIFKTIKVYDYRLTVGVLSNKNKLFWKVINRDKVKYLYDIAFVTILLGTILFFVLKDILDLSRLITSKDRGQVAKLKAVSREGEALLKAAVSYEKNQKNLKHEKEFLAASLTPAILHELENQTPVPSTFESTMVRVDLNGYTQLYLDKKDEYVTGILNKYFVAARELIERYQGLVYQYVGDEVVFHFKGPRAEVEPIATACVRSLFELAEEVEKTLPPEAGHYFKLKASLASGTIRFIQLDTGFALTGMPLIESARLLGQNDDKARNSLAVYDSSRPYISKLCVPSEAKESHLKGFSEPALVCTITEFTTHEKIIEKNQAELCTYFRSDLNLIANLKYFEGLVVPQHENLFFRVFKDFGNLKTHLICSELEAAVCRFLEATYRKSHDQAINPKVLSAAVSLTQHLVPVGQGSAKLTEILKLYLQFSNARVQANALLVLGEMPSNVIFLKKFIHARDNRLSADALVVAGKQVVDQELVKRIHSLLKSPDKVYQASGRYVIMTLVEHYKTNDVIYYNTNPHLKKLEDLLGKAA